MPLLLATALVAGCGGDGGNGESGAATGAEAEATVRAYVGSIYSGDFADACEQLANPAKVQLVEVSTFPGGPELDDCEAALDLAQSIGALDIPASGVMDHERVTADAEDSQIEVIEAEEGRATLRVAESEKTATVTRSGDEWKISELDFSDTPQ